MAALPWFNTVIVAKYGSLAENTPPSSLLLLSDNLQSFALLATINIFTHLITNYKLSLVRALNNMKGESITAFMKGLKAILSQMETVPHRSCHKRVLTQAATPPPTIHLDLGDDELFPCDCTLQSRNSLDAAYLSNPLLSSLKTKECGLDYIRRALDSLEAMSSCTRCSGKEYVRAFLYLLCRTILQRCRAFYQHLVRTYEGKDQQPLLLDDYQLATVEERAALLCMLTYVEIKRFHDCVGRIIETLKEQPLFDEDSWTLIKGQAYKLAIDTAELRFRSIHC